MSKNIFGVLLLVGFLVFQSCSSNVSNNIDGAAAHWVSDSILIWDAPSEAETLELRYSDDASITVSKGRVSGGVSIPLTGTIALNDSLADRYRHIAYRTVFSLEPEFETIVAAIKGQIVAIAYDKRGRVIDATRVQFPGVIDQHFVFNGTLGPVYKNDNITLNVWAPTAQKVELIIYDENKKEIDRFQASGNYSEYGVWNFNGPRDWDRRFYRFLVSVYHHETNRIEHFEVTDPYSVSLSTDSFYSQFADLGGDATLKPRGWDNLRKRLPIHTDITLYEGHVRDFSIKDPSVPLEYRGTYKAFTLNGKNGRPLSNGMAHLKRLSEAGLTHLHLLPINDIATVIENTNLRVDLDDPYNRICELIDHAGLKEECELHGDKTIREVFTMLAAENPVTDRIQLPYDLPGRYNGMASKDGFNWGYDPFHFNAPEGSYATNPEGVTRILEVREMVQALYEIGLKIVVDVVYNHTFASGDSRFSVLDKVVPGYYQRYDATTGAIETSTCCDNTAAEHLMMEKLIIDSVILWAKHYKIDSFRFDLMGHHPKQVMINLVEALKELTLEEHGVDGKNIYIYGEGWNFGEVADNRIFDQATQFMMGGTGIGNFNDRSRDAIRGRNFTDSGRFQGFTSGQFLFPNEDNNDSDETQLANLLSQADRIRVGMTGNLSSYEYINRYGERVNGLHEWIGFALMPQESVNYIDKHDNETLWDNTQAKLPKDMGMDDRVRIHMLSQAFKNYGQGIPFYQMGSDILRSKSMDRNSFDSGDWFNAIDWSLESHNWAIGLPPGWDNRDRWEAMREIMTNPNIQVNREHMQFAHNVFIDQLRVRYSSPLFRLPDAQAVHRRVKFHNTGPDQIPGIIAVSYSDGRCAGSVLDRNYDGIVVIFNAHVEAQSIQIDGMNGMRLHPLLMNGSDPIVKDASVNGNTFTVPALTAAVFVKPQQRSQGEFTCNFMD